MKILLLLPIFTLSAAAAVPPDHAEKMTRGLELFRKETGPLLREHCVKCHGGEKTKGDFDLATRDGLLRGGAEGPAVKPFSAAESHMMKLIRHEEEPAMPEKKPKLPDEVIAKIAQWIDLGAPYDGPLVEGKAPPRDKSAVTDADRKWWAFQPLAKVQPPAGAAHPVDAFLLEAAKAKGLGMNPPAESRVLARRAALLLTGLPLEADRSDRSGPSDPIDRLLASPAYGERWARHWLDVARFAESSGFEHDYDRPFAFHYRDFVIKALNADMPFDQFARWQLAGDELAPGDPLALMATGFLGAGVFPTQITANEVERTRYDAMDDMLSTTGSAFLGLTVGCARCHDHKFDPIPAKDYYAMLSTFTTTVRSNIEIEIDPEKIKTRRAEWSEKGRGLAADLVATEVALQPQFEKWLAAGAGDVAASSWTVLAPSELKSSANATFKPLGDGSYLVEGENGAWDTYTITAPVEGRGIRALRLEALAHPSMKSKGPGRAGNGNFGLGKIEISAGGADVKVARAFADHEQNKAGLSIAASLDMDTSSGWAVDGQIGKDHAAVFVFDKPLDAAPGTKLVVKLSFTVNTQHNIGRPRFAITSASEPKLEGGALSGAILAALNAVRNGGKPDAAGRVALFDWWKQREKAWQKASSKLADHNAKEPNGKESVMVCAEGYKPIVMHSQGAPFLKETHFLRRGDTNQKQDVATQGFLQVLSRGDGAKWRWEPPKGAQFSGRRATLANWLTDVEHGGGALMARVAVNRLWQHHFGRGLVATPNDFGKTGALPSNPALLDWLAGELVRGGWKLKPLHRLIMTSAAWQQNSAADSAKIAADPDNALFLRRIPQRLEGEAVRDSILAVAGTLDRTMFGPGTLKEASTRRSIYFTVKRSQLVNSMVVFDAPEPLSSQGARPTTTVAPQALLMMNSPQIREWSAAFAKRVEAAAGGSDPRKLVESTFQLALGRAPRLAEATAAAAFIAAGGKLADLCQTVLSLNEFVYVE